MIKYVCLSIFLALLACNKPQVVVAEKPQVDSIIHLADAIDTMQDINLSVIADSITYLPAMKTVRINPHASLYRS